ncbi:uncharacterized protein LOC131889320 [Tigriopus californicus]|uniref:uncharacterized protein LOC131889320 n=1 Tax=Tigriopus californicus TaxID=6832 RepID=UPI0027DA032E|nr:uncharacterized protein LOC131889320 [Tigriopus californicus]
MESPVSPGPPPKGVHLSKVSLGQWQLFVQEQEPDLLINDQPFVALTMMYHSETHEYIWRVLGRLVESGQVSGFSAFLGKCHQLFNNGTPCLGMKPPDAKFPLSCQFSKNCSIMIPKSSESQTCQACQTSLEDPVQFWRAIQEVAEDMLYDRGYKTFDALNRSYPPVKAWQCIMCSMQVPLSDIRTHLEKEHLLSHFVCFHCDDRFVDAKDLSFHTLQAHPEIQELFCPLCPENVPINGEIDSLANHFRICFENKNKIVDQEETARRVLVCQFCTSPFFSKKVFEKHVVACVASRGRTQVAEDDVVQRVQHVQEVDKRVQPASDSSMMSSTSKTKLLPPPIDNPLETRANHPGPSKATCPECWKKIGAKFLSRHLMVHHRLGDFKCSTCSVTCQSAEELTNHFSDAHPSQLDQVCPNCAKDVDISNDRQSFVHHVKACHKIIFLTNMKGKRVPFKGSICSDCGQIFRNKAALDQHELQACNQMVPMKRNKTYSKESSLSEPSAPHHQQNGSINQISFSCAFCSEICDSRESLANHLKVTCDVNLRTSHPTDSVRDFLPLSRVDEFLESSVDLELESVDVMDDLDRVKVEPEPKDITSKDPLCLNLPKPQVVVMYRNVQKTAKEVRVVPPISTYSNPTQCQICFRRIPNRIFHKHMMFRHQMGQFLCLKCLQQFETATQISRHTIAHSDVTELNCPNCKKDISLGSDRKGLEDHIQTCHKLKFRWDGTTQKHVEYIGRVCMDCGKDYETLEQLMRHEALDTCESGRHAPEQRKKYVYHLRKLKKQIQHRKISSSHVICDICGEKLVGNEKLKYHHRQKHPVNSCLCPFCGMECSNKSTLQYHLNKFHPKSDETTCKDCGLIKPTVSSLKAHARIHKPPEILCPICGKRFTKPEYLTLHNRIHTGEKRYKCDLCDFKTAVGSNLTNHKKTMEIEANEKEDHPSELANLVKVPLGQWQLFLRENPDLYINGQPFVGLTLMYHPKTHEYIWRALGKIVESGQVTTYREFLDRCRKFFNSGVPCLGMKSPDAQFPLSCQFSDNCYIIIPQSTGATACQACLQSADDPVGFWQEIQNAAQDIIYDGGVKTLDALNRSHAKAWPCLLCSVQVPLASIKGHLEQEHFLCHFVCHHCDDRFVDAKDLSFHTLQEHPEVQVLFCPLCPTNVPLSGGIDGLANHFRVCCSNKHKILRQNETGIMVFECQLCHLKFGSKEMAQKHVDECRGLRALKSVIEVIESEKVNSVQAPHVPTNASLVLNKDWPTFSKDSQNRQSDSSKISCRLCDKEIGAKFLSRHLMFHHCMGDFKCNSCPLVYQTAKELTDHISDAHPSQTSQICPNCAKDVPIWDRRRTLANHMETCHKIIFLTNMKGKRVPFKGSICSDCGQIFRNKTDLDQHESRGCNQEMHMKRMETSTKTSHQKKSVPTLPHPLVGNKHICGFCSQTFSSRNHLANHLQKACDAKLRTNNPDDLNGSPSTLSRVDEFLQSSLDLNLETVDDIDSLNMVEAKSDFHSPQETNDNSPQDPLAINPEPKGRIMFLNVQKLKNDIPDGSPELRLSNKVDCHVCFKKLSPESLLKHKMFRHQLGQFDCPKCRLQFVTAEHVSKHLTAHPDVSELRCPNCKQSVTLGADLKGLVSHMATCSKLKFRWDETTQEHVQDIRLECIDCEQGFGTPEELAEHEDVTCTFEEDASRLRVEYLENLIKMRNRTQYIRTSSKHVICDVCDRKFVGAHKLKDHKAKQHPSNPLLCDTCGMDFINETKLQIHINRAHPTSDKLTCKDCGYRGGNERLLRVHQEIHGPARLMCPTCGKRFTRRVYLRSHMRIHTGEKPCKCDLCGYSTAFIGNLINHKKFVHQKIPREPKSKKTTRKKQLKEYQSNPQ